MQRWMIGTLAILAVVLMLAGTAHGRIMAPPSVPDRVARVETIILGKVTAIEEKPINVGGQEQQVAVIQVNEALMGGKGLTHVRLAFVPGVNPRFPQLVPSAGQEACYFLTKSPAGAYYMTANYWDVLDKKNPNYDKEVALIRRCAKLLNDPNAGLKSKDAGEQLITAAMLITRYRFPPPNARPPLKQEPIDAEQSKLILLALANADWTKTEPELRLAPQGVFARLSLMPADGWTQPKDFKEVPAAAKKWLNENAGKYRIQRYVVEAPEKK